MDQFVTIIISILILSFLVIIHEIGHFLVAKWSKITVQEFGLGYPPRAFTLFTWKGTIFSFNWIPFGGFVKMEGEDEIVLDQSTQSSAGNSQSHHSVSVEKSPIVKPISPEITGQPFYAASRLSRLTVIVAGATVNFIFGIIAFSIVFSLTGIPTETSSTRIVSIGENSPAARAQVPTEVAVIGFQIGETVTQTKDITSIRQFAQAHQGQTVTLLTTGICHPSDGCAESLQSFPLTIRTEAEVPPDQGLLGLAFASGVEFRFYPWYEMPLRGSWYGLQQAIGLSFMIVHALSQLVMQLTHGTIPQDMAGPVGIVDQVHQSGLFKEGWAAMLSFAGMLSVNLAIMNMLPIPALDGGRAVFILLEAVAGRSRVAKIEYYANTGGFLVLVGLILMVTARDVWRLFH